MRRFVLIGHERSGSNLLVDALSSHPGAVCFAELFNQSSDRRHFAQAFDGDWYRDGADPVAFLRSSVYAEGRAAAVGFKLFYDQARTPSTAAAWSYLAAERDIRIVHIARANLLEVLVSREVATRTNVWTVREGTPFQEPEPFEIAPERAEHYFNRILACRWWAERTFRRHRQHWIDYESLVGHFDEVVQGLYAFLSLPPHPARMAFRKQMHRRPSEQIANYEALRRHFRGSIYEVYFEDRALGSEGTEKPSMP